MLLAEPEGKVSQSKISISFLRPCFYKIYSYPYCCLFLLNRSFSSTFIISIDFVVGNHQISTKSRAFRSAQVCQAMEYQLQTQVNRHLETISLLVHSLIHLFIYLFIHSFTHSLIRLFAASPPLSALQPSLCSTLSWANSRLLSLLMCPTSRKQSRHCCHTQV